MFRELDSIAKVGAAIVLFNLLLESLPKKYLLTNFPVSPTSIKGSGVLRCKPKVKSFAHF